ncbi:MAG: Lar family restriction alleviation protein [Synergistaceae bacterium]|nr:Lar family restriction alleviation protein [Synergistaceae bacterium]
MSEIKLKPCPFCGSDKLLIYPPDDEFRQREKGRAYWGHVSCECGAECCAKCYSAYPDKARAMAIDIWNKRKQY